MHIDALRNVVPLRKPTPALATERLRVVDRAHASCSACGSLAFCVPTGDRPAATWQLDDLVSHRLRLRKGDVLVRSGDRFAALYSIRTGSCKSVATTASGQQQIAAYHIAGDMLGAGAIFGNAYDATVIALEDSEFCVIPFDRMETLAQQNGEFQHTLCALLSREIGRERRVMLMLGTMRAEQRLASFLLDLADRYHARGYSSSEFVLRMTREEIGSHLGLKLETVSRLFSRFHHDGLIRVQGRDVKLLDRVALHHLVDASLQ
jgi:CRP/FNR family transcriptional regulator, anaerobic regulatory protein